MRVSRLQFAPTNTDRRPNTNSPTTSPFDEDILFTNGVVFLDQGDKMRVAVRPGVPAGSQLKSSATEGRGVAYWNDTNYYFVDNGVYKGSTKLAGNLETTSGRIHWDTAISNNGLLVFQDGERVYSIDETDKVTCVNAPAWTDTTVYAAGDFVTNDTNKVYIVAAGGGGTSHTSGGPTGTGSAISDGTVTWDYVNTVTGGSNIPTAIVPGLVVLDQYVFVADADGNIYNSNVGDVFTWTAGDQINSELLADDLKGIARHVNYIAALGEFGTEFLYNAANLNGSPLSRLEGTFIYTGCHDGNTATNIDDKLLWVSKSQSGGLDVVVLTGFELKRVATTAVQTMLQARRGDALWDGDFYAWQKKRLYVLSICPQTDLDDGHCFVYDLDRELWYQWSYINSNGWPFRGSAAVSSSLFSSVEAKEQIAMIDRAPNVNDTDNGIHQRFVLSNVGQPDQYFNTSSAVKEEPITANIQTVEWDGGRQNTNPKFIHKIELLGDSPTTGGSTTALTTTPWPAVMPVVTVGEEDAGAIVETTIKWQDEDAHASVGPLYSAARTFPNDISSSSSTSRRLTRCGVARRRRFFITHKADNSRIEGLDIYYTEGEGGQT